MIFVCDKNHRTEILPCIQDKPTACPECGGAVHVDCTCTGRAGVIRSKTHRGYYCTSLSAGCHPSQVAEMRRRFPHHEYVIGKGGLAEMAFTSKSHRRQCLRDIGMFDRDGNDSPVNK